MPAVKSDVSPGTPPEAVSKPTAADGLRAIADWIDEHPELGAAFGGIGFLSKDRADLERFAAALGETATERATALHVHITGEFPGGLTVYSLVSFAELRDEPQYEPILPSRDEEPQR